MDDDKKVKHLDVTDEESGTADKMRSDATEADLLSDDAALDDVASTEARPVFWHRRSTLVAVGAAALVIVLAAGGGFAWNTHERDAALSGCREHAASFSKLRDAKDGKDVVEALGVGRDGVADAGTWDALQRADKEWGRLRGQGVPSCDASSRRAARDREREAASRPDSLRGARAGLDSAAKAVLGSRDAKALSDARGSLSGKVGEYRGLLESSAGNVADDATRTALSQQLDAAGGLLGSKDARLADLQAAVQSLDGAADGVNASVRAKADADAQAAAAAQAQAQAAESSRASRQGSSSGAQPGSGRGSRAPRPSAPSSGSGGRSSRPSAPSPRPSAPSGGSSPSDSSGNSGFDLTPSAPIPGCVNHQGFCPIG
ncbi:hypothetical protein FHX77_001226 [Bifidobacterium commune]|uniref:Uncharacterized protein n=1 Tax=Bifidobacterium commune TaxID=1505727 RepID=A0A1C4H578_9BIFI|nr:hypothetical protein [Bifidobacterium commune]MBB2955794.1 hypothetical protein [Bifidobacterium commune]SCC80066.1 hypothetical protein GA0061077_0981 [Bifidobacterium commune]